VADEGHILDILNAHYACQAARRFAAPEHDTVFDFMPKLFAKHVRFRPAIRGDDPFISLRTVVDDGPDQLKVAIVTAADHE
jgi:hypothetical protein